MNFFKKFFRPSFFSEKVFQSLAPKDFFKLQRLKFFLYLLSFFLFLLLFLRPQGDLIFTDSETSSYKFAFAVDTSLSMLADDGQNQTRLERSKDYILSTVKNFGAGNFALLEFANTSFISIPFTSDLSSFESIVSLVAPAEKSDAGTDLQTVIGNSIKIFASQESEEKYLIIFSDGEIHKEFSAYEELKKNGVTVITFGVGSKEGSKILLGNFGFQNIYKKYQGKDVITKLEPDFLKELASETGGAYFHESDFSAFLSYLSSKTSSSTSSSTVTERKEYFPLLAAFLIFVLILELFAFRLVRFLPFFAVVILFSSCNSDWKDGVESYVQKDFPSSSEIFEKLSRDSEDERLKFNYGASLYKEGKFEDALKEFSQIRDGDLLETGNVEYQVGNTLYRIGEGFADLDKKIDARKQVLKYYELGLQKAPENQKMKENREFVKKKLEEAEKEKEEQEKQGGGGQGEPKEAEGDQQGEQQNGQGQGQVQLDKKDLEGLQESLEEMKGQERQLRGNFDRQGNEEFKLEREPSRMFMETIEDLLRQGMGGAEGEINSQEKDW